MSVPGGKEEVPNILLKVYKGGWIIPRSLDPTRA
jgi:hypothetical protein